VPIFYKSVKSLLTCEGSVSSFFFWMTTSWSCWSEAARTGSTWCRSDNVNVDSSPRSHL